MFRLPSGRALALIALAAAVGLSSCSILKPKKHPQLAYEERPVELLYNAGADRLDHHQWNEAVDYFREVERQHPYSEWARRSILMTAYAHYMGNNYAEAISDSDQFISLYPGNPTTPYAYYLKAICYFEQIVDVGRDQASTAEAGEALREVAKRYPNSEYAEDARLKLDMVQDQLAGKEMTVGRYYLNTGNPMAAIGRFRTVVEKYQTTSHTPEALYRLVEAYLTVGLIDEAQKNASVLGFNYPGDPWYRDAYNLMQQHGYQQAVAPDANGHRGPHFPFLFGHPDKNATLAPPPPAGDQSNAAANPAPPTPIGPQTPAKPTGLLHGILGL